MRELLRDRDLALMPEPLRLWFDHTGGGLQARGGGELTGFKIAGKDGNFVPAEAKIEGRHAGGGMGDRPRGQPVVSYRVGIDDVGRFLRHH